MVSAGRILWTSDRDFNKDEIRDQRYFLVAEHNDLITKARHDLNARELKIMDYVVSKIKPNDEKTIFSKLQSNYNIMLHHFFIFQNSIILEAPPAAS